MGIKVYLLLCVVTILICTFMIFYQSTTEMAEAMKPTVTESEPVALISEPSKTLKQTEKTKPENENDPVSSNILKQKNTRTMTAKEQQPLLSTDDILKSSQEKTTAPLNVEHQISSDQVPIDEANKKNPKELPPWKYI